jgi:hypothetical protein
MSQGCNVAARRKHTTDQESEAAGNKIGKPTSEG